MARTRREGKAGRQEEREVDEPPDSGSWQIGTFPPHPPDSAARPLTGRCARAPAACEFSEDPGRHAASSTLSEAWKGLDEIYQTAPALGCRRRGEAGRGRFCFFTLARDLQVSCESANCLTIRKSLRKNEPVGVKTPSDVPVTPRGLPPTTL